MKKLVSIKPRDGGKSATISYPVPVKAGRQSVIARLSVGAIRINDDGKSKPFGAGFIKFRDGYDLSLLNDEDQAAAHEWLEEALANQVESTAAAKVTLSDIDAKVDVLLGLVRDGLTAASPGASTGPLSPAAVPPTVYVLPDGAVPGEDDEARLLRLLRTFNAAAAEIAPMMPKAANVFHIKYKFRPETIDEVERSWVLASTMDKRLNGRGQLKRTGPREERAQSRFGTVESGSDTADGDELPAA